MPGGGGEGPGRGAPSRQPVRDSPVRQRSPRGVPGRPVLRDGRRCGGTGRAEAIVQAPPPPACCSSSLVLGGEVFRCCVVGDRVWSGLVTTNQSDGVSIASACETLITKLPCWLGRLRTSFVCRRHGGTLHLDGAVWGNMWKIRAASQTQGTTQDAQELGHRGRGAVVCTP